MIPLLRYWSHHIAKDRKQNVVVANREGIRDCLMGTEFELGLTEFWRWVVAQNMNIHFCC